MFNCRQKLSRVWVKVLIEQVRYHNSLAGTRRRSPSIAQHSAAQRSAAQRLSKQRFTHVQSE